MIQYRRNSSRGRDIHHSQWDPQPDSGHTGGVFVSQYVGTIGVTLCYIGGILLLINYPIKR